MKEITSTVYKAFDGKEFVSRSDCVEYEANAFKDVNLQKFDVQIPYGDDGLYTHVAYKITSENEFNMFMTYLKYNYSDIYGIEEYSGNGWYMERNCCTTLWILKGSRNAPFYLIRIQN